MEINDSEENPKYNKITQILKDNNVAQWESAAFLQLIDYMNYEALSTMSKSYEFSRMANRIEIDREDVIMATASQNDPPIHTKSSLDTKVAESINSIDLPLPNDGAGLPVNFSGEGSLLTPNWQLTRQDLLSNNNK